MAGVETLRAWLLDAGGIKLRHVDGVLAKLEEELVDVEYEYAAHCFYDHVPGKRCSVCSFDPKKTQASLYAMTRDSDSESDDAPDGGVDCEDDRDAILAPTYRIPTTTKLTSRLVSARWSQLRKGPMPLR